MGPAIRNATPVETVKGGTQDRRKGRVAEKARTKRSTEKFRVWHRGRRRWKEPRAKKLWGKSHSELLR